MPWSPAKPPDVGGLRAALRGPEMVFATFSMLPTPAVAEIVAVAGFDMVILDLEHSAHTLQTLEASILAATARGIKTVIRVADGRPSSIQTALDLGPHGVIIPQVSSPEEAAAIVSAARFPPVGTRGVNPWVRAGSFGLDPDYLVTANADTAVMVMLEGREAIERAGSIMAVPGLDAVFLGPVDLAASLGHPGQTDHPAVLAAMRGIIDMAESQSVAVAAFAPDVDRARSLVKLGVRLVACGEDTQILAVAYRNLVDRFQE